MLCITSLELIYLTTWEFVPFDQPLPISSTPQPLVTTMLLFL